MRELRAEQHDLRRVVDPDQHHDDRRRRAVGRFQALLADVEADQELADLEQRGSAHAAQPDVAPFDSRVGQPLEHHDEQRADGGERHQEGRRLHQGLRHERAEGPRKCRQRRRQQHRHEQQEADRQDARQGKDVAAGEAPDAATGLGLHLPHDVQRFLELHHDADRREDERDGADDGGKDAFAGRAGRREHGVDRFRRPCRRAGREWPGSPPAARPPARRTGRPAR